MKLNGRTAVVTGGGRGIGRAYCERLAADGANVVVLDIHDATPVVDALGGSGDKTGMICDVSKPEQITEVANAVLKRFGRCDIFVNNAAIFPVTDLKTVTLEVWRRVQAVNVEPLVLFAQAFVPGMAEAHWGRIVSTGSSVTHPGAPVSFEQSPSGYKLAFEMQASDVEMVLAPDMRLQSATLKAPQSAHFETSFASGQQGFLLTSWTMGEDGDSEPGHRLIFTYTYQTVDGVKLPEQVAVIRESHHEVWRYRLSDCIVKTSK